MGPKQSLNGAFFCCFGCPAGYAQISLLNGVARHRAGVRPPRLRALRRASICQKLLISLYRVGLEKQRVRWGQWASGSFCEQTAKVTTQNRMPGAPESLVAFSTISMSVVQGGPNRTAPGRMSELSCAPHSHISNPMGHKQRKKQREIAAPRHASRRKGDGKRRERPLCLM